MRSRESIQQFQLRRGMTSVQLAPVHVSRLEDHERGDRGQFRARDFYKIMLFEEAAGELCYPDKSFPVRARSLVFTDSYVPYCWEGNREQVKGFLCVYTDAMVAAASKGQALALSPVYYLEEEPFELVRTIFQQMAAETPGDYSDKIDLIKNYVQILVHTALKLTAPVDSFCSGTSGERIAKLFISLLERQFPISHPGEVLALRNASEFAARLNLHTNHLNKMLREHTGKTTSEHIAGYMVREASSLLRHSDWSVSAIAHSLGFNHVSNFDTFFKRQAGQTPFQFRAGKISAT